MSSFLYRLQPLQVSRLPCLFRMFAFPSNSCILGFVIWQQQGYDFYRKTPFSISCISMSRPVYPCRNINPSSVYGWNNIHKIDLVVDGDLGELTAPRSVRPVPPPLPSLPYPARQRRLQEIKSYFTSSRGFECLPSWGSFLKNLRYRPVPVPCRKAAPAFSQKDQGCKQLILL